MPDFADLKFKTLSGLPALSNLHDKDLFEVSEWDSDNSSYQSKKIAWELIINKFREQAAGTVGSLKILLQDDSADDVSDGNLKVGIYNKSLNNLINESKIIGLNSDTVDGKHWNQINYDVVITNEDSDPAQKLIDALTNDNVSSIFLHNTTPVLDQEQITMLYNGNAKLIRGSGAENCGIRFKKNGNHGSTLFVRGNHITIFEDISLTFVDSDDEQNMFDITSNTQDEKGEIRFYNCLFGAQQTSWSSGSTAETNSIINPDLTLTTKVYLTNCSFYGFQNLIDKYPFSITLLSTGTISGNRGKHNSDYSNGFFRIVNNSYLDAHSLAGRSLGNSSGDVPISNGTKNENLNADMLDGKHLNDIMVDLKPTEKIYFSLWENLGRWPNPDTVQSKLQESMSSSKTINEGSIIIFRDKYSADTYHGNSSSFFEGVNVSYFIVTGGNLQKDTVPTLLDPVESGEIEYIR